MHVVPTDQYINTCDCGAVVTMKHYALFPEGKSWKEFCLQAEPPENRWFGPCSRCGCIFIPIEDKPAEIV